MNSLVKKTLVGGCVIFTCAMAIWTLAGFIFAGAEWGLVVTATLLISCIALAILQTFWFTNRIIKKMPYPARVLGFGVTAFVVLASCAYVGNWMPNDNVGAWISFTVIYLVILGIMTAAFTAYYRKTARDLDEALSRYRSGQ